MSKVLTLSGWAQSPDALNMICPDGAEVTACDYSEYQDFDALCAALHGGAYDVVMGWSLGGQLALRLLGQGAISAQKLILICAPHQFVRDEAAPYGMEGWLFEQFYENYSGDPARTAKRFAGLIAKGDARMKEVMREMLPHEAVDETERWAGWLKALGETSLNGASFANIPDTLLVHGAEDALVKPAQSEWLARHLPHARLEIIEGCAHAPHVHDLVRLKASVEAFLHG